VLLPFTKAMVPRIEFDNGRIVIKLPREAEDED
jgi:ribosomal 30S subunit maturation factor RimM